MNADRLEPEQRAALGEILRSPRYELVPLSSALPASEAIPAGGTATVTASARKGMEGTVELAVRLQESGLKAVPHVAARLVRDEAHLERILGTLADAGVDEIFVIGGDGEAQGEFSESLQVIEAVERLGHSFKIGIGGYPEGHSLISDSELDEALGAKSEHASYIATQMCFDPEAIVGWVESVRRRGIDLPVLVGVPGVVAFTRLIPVAARIGVGQSIRFLRRQRGLLRSLISTSYSPTDLLVRLAPTLAATKAGVSGLHIYSFNQVAATEDWRLKLLEDLEG